MVYVMYEKTVRTIERKRIRKRDTHKQTLFRTKKERARK